MKTTKESTEKKVVKTEVELSAIEKVRKLMEFSIENGATESEVENAVKLAQRLMVKHNLEQQDIEMSTNDVNITRIQSTWNGKVSALEVRSFECQLLMVLGKVNSCTIVVDRNKSTNTDFYDIVGLPEDREILILTYESILPQIRTLYRKRYRETDKSISEFKFVTSYTAGFLMGLRKKLETKDKDIKVGEMKTFELIVVKKDALIEEWLKENMNLKKSKPKSTSLDKPSFEKGLEDGSEKGLDKQLGEKN